MNKFFYSFLLIQTLCFYTWKQKKHFLVIFSSHYFVSVKFSLSVRIKVAFWIINLCFSCHIDLCMNESQYYEYSIGAICGYYDYQKNNLPSCFIKKIIFTFHSTLNAIFIQIFVKISSSVDFPSSNQLELGSNITIRVLPIVTKQKQHLSGVNECLFTLWISKKTH